jgi:DNA polymerase V
LYENQIKQQEDRFMPRGGKRTDSGRPKGSGKFGVETKAIRLPANEIEEVLKYIQNKFYRLPFYQDAISAGFPNQASEEVEDTLDLNELLIRRPAATFFLRVTGNSMIKAGIFHGDILIVDRSIEPISGKIVIAAVNGELTVKRLVIEDNRVQLVAENDVYRPIEITGEIDLHIWGVVTNVIHAL